MVYLSGYLAALIIGFTGCSTKASPPNYIVFYRALAPELPALCLSARRGERWSSRALVKDLTSLSANQDWMHESRFFITLKALAYRQRLDPLGLNDFANGRAVSITARGHRYVLVILKAPPRVAPGSESVQLILLSADGNALDRIESTIPVSLDEGLETKVLTKPAWDGAVLVIQATDVDDEFPPWEKITHGGKTYTIRAKKRAAINPFEEAGSDIPVREALGWSDGMCRLKIQDAKFVCLFPKLAQPDPEKSRR